MDRCHSTRQGRKRPLRLPLFVAISAMLLSAAAPREAALAQLAVPQFADYSKGPQWFPNLLKPYSRQPIPPPSFQNSPDLAAGLRNGGLPVSLHQVLAAVAGNNLDIAASRYNYLISATDVLRSKAGDAPRGAPGMRIPGGLGAGLGGGPVTGGFFAQSARLVTVPPRGTLDPDLTLTFGLDTTTVPQANTRVSGATEVTSHAASIQARYAQAFTSGTSFSLAFNTQRQSSTSRNQRFNPAFSSNYNLAINQQLLSGFGFASNRRFIRVAETNRQVARNVFHQQVVTTLAQAEDLYWDLVAAQQRVRTSQQALTVSERLLSDHRKEVEIGTRAPLDVVAAEAEVAARRRDLIIAETNVQVTELRLRNMMSRRMEMSFEGVRIEPTDPLPEPADGDIPPFDDALANAMRNRPELHQAEGVIRNQQVAVDFTAKRLLPTLSVFAMLGSGGRAGALNTAWTQVGSLDFPEYAYGFAFSFSLGNRAAQADNLNARLNLQQTETSLQRTRNQVRLEVRNALTGLQQTKARVAAAVRTVRASEQTLDAEQKKLRAGTSTSYNVIRVQRDLFSAQLAEVQARTDYAKARVELSRATGVAIERAGLQLEQLLGVPSENPPAGN
jgi:outer membrane protein TolC